MRKFANFFMNIVKTGFGIALLVLAVSSIEFAALLKTDMFSINIIVVLIVAILLSIGVLFLKIQDKFKILLLLLIAAVVRIWWIISVNSIPVSDFETMYESAQAITKGDLTAFRDFNYLARFPHLIPMALYMTLFIALFPLYNLLVMKAINIILSVLSIYLLYKLSANFLRNEKLRYGILILGAVFPSFISYSSVLCTENIAIPLYILTVILFFNALKREKGNFKEFMICGILLGVSNLFRGVGIVFLIAFLIYILLCSENRKIKSMCGIISGFIITALAVSGILSALNIIENPLWKPKEPATTLLLKGSNIETSGKWSEQDAKFVEEHLRDTDLSKKCVEISIERISELSFSGAFKFYTTKFVSQWVFGDSGGAYWAFSNLKEFLSSQIIPVPFQLIFIFVTILMFGSLISKNKENMLFFVLLCGFGIMFMIIETQPRYSYISSWIFLILAMNGLETYIDIFKEIRNGKKGVKLLGKV